MKKSKTLKRAIALCLALIMAVGVFNVRLFADQDLSSYVVEFGNDHRVLTRSELEANPEWFDAWENGTLTVTFMPDSEEEMLEMFSLQEGLIWTAKQVIHNRPPTDDGAYLGEVVGNFRWDGYRWEVLRAEAEVTLFAWGRTFWQEPMSSGDAEGALLAMAAYIELGEEALVEGNATETEEVEVTADEAADTETGETADEETIDEETVDETPDEPTADEPTPDEPTPDEPTPAPTGTPELIVEKTVADEMNTGFASPGANLTYTITIYNAGDGPALDVAVQDDLAYMAPYLYAPEGEVTFTGVDMTAELTCLMAGIIIDRIDPGETVTLTFTVTVYSHIDVEEVTELVNVANIDDAWGKVTILTQLPTMTTAPPTIEDEPTPAAAPPVANDDGDAPPVEAPTGEGDLAGDPATGAETTAGETTTQEDPTSPVLYAAYEDYYGFAPFAERGGSEKEYRPLDPDRPFIVISDSLWDFHLQEDSIVSNVGLQTTTDTLGDPQNEAAGWDIYLSADGNQLVWRVHQSVFSVGDGTVEDAEKGLLSGYDRSFSEGPVTLTFTIYLDEMEFDTEHIYTSGLAESVRYYPNMDNHLYWERYQMTDNVMNQISFSWNNGNGFTDGSFFDMWVRPDGYTGPAGYSFNALFNFGKNNTTTNGQNYTDPGAQWTIGGVAISVNDPNLPYDFIPGNYDFHTNWPKGAGDYIITIRDFPHPGEYTQYVIHVTGSGGNMQGLPGTREVISDVWIPRTHYPDNPTMPINWEADGAIRGNLDAYASVRLVAQPPYAGAIEIHKELFSFLDGFDFARDWGVTDDTYFYVVIINDSNNEYLILNETGNISSGFVYTFEGTTANPIFATQVRFSVNNPAWVKGVPADMDTTRGGGHRYRVEERMAATGLPNTQLMWDNTADIGVFYVEPLDETEMEDRSNATQITVVNTFEHGIGNLVVRKNIRGATEENDIDINTVFYVRIWDIDAGNYLLFLTDPVTESSPGLKSEFPGTFWCVGNQQLGFTEAVPADAGIMMEIPVTAASLQGITMSNLWTWGAYEVREVRRTGEKTVAEMNDLWDTWRATAPTVPFFEDEVWLDIAGVQEFFGPIDADGNPTTDEGWFSLWETVPDLIDSNFFYDPDLEWAVNHLGNNVDVPFLGQAVVTMENFWRQDEGTMQIRKTLSGDYREWGYGYTTTFHAHVFNDVDRAGAPDTLLFEEWHNGFGEIIWRNVGYIPYGTTSRVFYLAYDEDRNSDNPGLFTTQVNFSVNRGAMLDAYGPANIVGLPAGPENFYFVKEYFPPDDPVAHMRQSTVTVDGGPFPMSPIDPGEITGVNTNPLGPLYVVINNAFDTGEEQGIIRKDLRGFWFTWEDINPNTTFYLQVFSPQWTALVDSYLEDEENPLSDIEDLNIVAATFDHIPGATPLEDRWVYRPGGDGAVTLYSLAFNETGPGRFDFVDDYTDAGIITKLPFSQEIPAIMDNMNRAWQWASVEWFRHPETDELVLAQDYFGDMLTITAEYDLSALTEDEHVLPVTIVNTFGPATAQSLTIEKVLPAIHPEGMDYDTSFNFHVYDVGFSTELLFVHASTHRFNDPAHPNFFGTEYTADDNVWWCVGNSTDFLSEDLNLLSPEHDEMIIALENLNTAKDNFRENYTGDNLALDLANDPGIGALSQAALAIALDLEIVTMEIPASVNSPAVLLNLWAGTSYRVVEVDYGVATPAYSGSVTRARVSAPSPIDFTGNTTPILWLNDVAVVTVVNTFEGHTVYYHDEEALLGDPPPNQTGKVAGDSITVSGQGTLDYPLHRFAGWRDRDTGILHQPVGTFTMPNDDVHLDAEWTPVYTLVYDIQGAEGDEPSDDGEYAVTEETLVKDDDDGDLFSKDGFRFKGWSLTPGGDSADDVDYAAGATFIFTAGIIEEHADANHEITLYAVWAPLYTIVYDANFGEGTGTGTALVDDNNPYEAGDDVTILGPGTLSKTPETIEGVPHNYVFRGWAFDPDATTPDFALADIGEIFELDDTFTDEADGEHVITLYAVWGLKHRVIYNANGGTGDVPVDTTQYEDGETVNVMWPSDVEEGETPIAKANHRFLGWARTNDATAPQYTPSGTTSFAMPDDEDTVILYAVWGEVFTIVYDANYGSGTGNDEVPTDPAGATGYVAGETVPVLPKGDLTRDPRLVGEYEHFYTFLGWAFTDDTDTPDFDTLPDSFTLTADIIDDYAEDNVITLYAIWEDPEIAEGLVQFLWNTSVSDNDLYVTPAATYQHGQVIAAPATDPTRDHFKFTGWYWDRVQTLPVNFTGLIFDPASPYMVVDPEDESLTLNIYAGWELLHGVTFDLNDSTEAPATGTTPPPIEDLDVGDDITMPGDSGFSRDGYRFRGWSLDPEADPDDDEAEIFTASDEPPVMGVEDLIFYAVWEPLYTIAYAPNFGTLGGTGDPVGDTGSYAAGEEVTVAGMGTIAKNPIEYGLITHPFTFLGWAWEEDATTPDFAVSAGVFTPPTFDLDATVLDLADEDRVVTLFAVWEPPTIPSGYAIFYRNYSDTDTTEVSKLQYFYGQTIVSPVSLDPSVPNPTRTGYRFDGWFTSQLTTPTTRISDATGIFTGQTMGDAGDMYYWARWVRLHTIVYDANDTPEEPIDGAMPEDDTVYEDGDSIIVKGDSGFTRPGYRFLGWSETPTGDVEWEEDDEIPMDEDMENITLYAVWEPVYTLVYDIQGGTGTTPPDDGEYAEDEFTTVAGDDDGDLFSKDGYHFKGWSLTAGGSSLSDVGYTAGAPFTFTADIIDEYADANHEITLYAVWALIHPVTYDINGGTGTTPVDDTEYEAGDPAIVLGDEDEEGDKLFTREGYRFLGWSTTRTGSVEYVEGDELEITEEDITLYAVWEPLFTVVYDANFQGAPGEGAGSGEGTVPTDSNYYGIADSVTVQGNTGDLENDPYLDSHDILHKWTFIGWSFYPDTPPDDAGIFTAGDLFRIEDAPYNRDRVVTLYAVWHDPEIIGAAIFMWNTSPTDENVYYSWIGADGAAVNPPADPSRTGYVFIGWYWDREAIDDVDFNDVFISANENWVFYAGWETVQEEEEDHAITVIVEDEDGDPIEDAEVIVYDEDGNEVERGHTDRNGRWTSKPLPDGNYTVVVNHPDYSAHDPIEVEIAGEDVEVIVTLVKPGSPPPPPPIINTPPQRPGRPLDYTPTPLIPYGPREVDFPVIAPPPTVPATLTPVRPMPIAHIHYAFMIGYAEDGTIRPQGNITRAEVTTIFFRLITDQHRADIWSQQNSFNDVDLGRWYNNPVSTMENGGLFAGVPLGASFNPNQPATRAEFAAMVVNYLGLGHHQNVQANAFTDTAGHWAQDAINVAFIQGWVNGFGDGTFRPDQPITRAEVAALINRALHRLPETTADLLPNMVEWPDNMDTTRWYYLYIQEATNSHYHTDKEDGIHETWTQLLPPRDWRKLERPDSGPWDR